MDVFLLNVLIKVFRNCRVDLFNAERPEKNDLDRHGAATLEWASLVTSYWQRLWTYDKVKGSTNKWETGARTSTGKYGLRRWQICSVTTCRVQNWAYFAALLWFAGACSGQMPLGIFWTLSTAPNMPSTTEHRARLRWGVRIIYIASSVIIEHIRPSDNSISFYLATD